jgi:hypothetical protein
MQAIKKCHFLVYKRNQAMKIGIQTWGSNGDIRPLLALADGLQQAGHAVTLVVSSIDNRSYADTCLSVIIFFIRSNWRQENNTNPISVSRFVMPLLKLPRKPRFVFRI